MKKIIKLTESDLTRLVKRVMSEQMVGAYSKAVIQLNSELSNMMLGNGTAAKNIQKVLNRCKRSKTSPTSTSNGIADKINYGVQGAGTYESTVYAALKRVKNSDELCTVSKSYQQRYGESLWEALDGDFDSQKEWSVISRIISNLLTNEKKKFKPVPKTTGGSSGKLLRGGTSAKINESNRYENLKEQYSDDGQLDVNELAKKIVLSKKYSEIVDEIQPTDYSDEFEFGDNFISNLLDEYFDEEYYDDLYDVVKMEYGDIILDLYGSSEE
tara:strand:+ start:652 stop:1461 length:810 start_codon:yes stop_codon:yes gene_type:complete